MPSGRLQWLTSCTSAILGEGLDNFETVHKLTFYINVFPFISLQLRKACEQQIYININIFIYFVHQILPRVIAE